MKRIQLIFLLAVIAMLATVSMSAATITVDGYKSSGEWNENWAFGQENVNIAVDNATLTPYDPNGPFGDRLVLRQGGLSIAVTDTWYGAYPNASAGPIFDQDMATDGDYSGFDIKKVYARYDPVNDIMYGMNEVYGMPGDLTGNKNVAGESPDTAGDPGPASGTILVGGVPTPAALDEDGIGLGRNQFWSITIVQGDKETSVEIINNDWLIEDDNVGLTYEDVNARFTFDEYKSVGDTTLPKSVYEISISNFSEYFDMAPGSTFKAQILAGSSGDVVGEDIVSVFFEVPEPNIEIIKYVSGDNVTWFDANTPAAGPLLDPGQDVYWRYVITNTGNEPLVNVMLIDDQIGSITCPQDTLAIGESMECFEQGTVPEVCQPPYYYRNIGTVEANGMFTGLPVMDSDPANYRCQPITENGNDVPLMTPLGLIVMISLLGIIGMVSMRKEN
ncbi:hypothetical protein [Methanosalsum natronophilum]|uniref:hypothetical protein n=1 Tax=Methanosalsum natronophilum TaxID=768733 RepID=UPI00216899E3|nr:hypothetical protein [Methanosalsum natronophilum]MCS3924942.1 hypothetical protein [Methanosalsum natronophilum]